jgi:hypothetical protein
MKKLLAFCLAFLAVCSLPQAQDPVQERSPAIRFSAIDVIADSGANPLAAYQLTVSAKIGTVRIVGIEGGEHPAFQDPPYYDPQAMQHDRVILAAFNTAPADKLPKGKTRLATIHLQITGATEPRYSIALQTAANTAGAPISCQVTLERKNTK